MLLLTVLEFVLTSLLIAFLGIYLVYASTFHPLCFSFQRPFQQFCLGDMVHSPLSALSRGLLKERQMQWHWH
jgi:hypothetical protein